MFLCQESATNRNCLVSICLNDAHSSGCLNIVQFNEQQKSKGCAIIYNMSRGPTLFTKQDPELQSLAIVKEVIVYFLKSPICKISICLFKKSPLIHLHLNITFCWKKVYVPEFKISTDHLNNCYIKLSKTKIIYILYIYIPEGICLPFVLYTLTNPANIVRIR